MLLTIEKVLLLRSIDIFSKTPDEYLVELVSLIEEVDYAAGETLIKKGETGTSMYIIASGQVQVSNGDQIYGTLGEREFFGELSALSPEPRSADITAIEDTHLLKIEGELLYELMSKHIEIVKNFMEVLCDRLRTAHSKSK